MPQFYCLIVFLTIHDKRFNEREKRMKKGEGEKEREKERREIEGESWERKKRRFPTGSLFILTLFSLEHECYFF